MKNVMGFKSNCTVVLSDDNLVLDIISDYDIAYRDLFNDGICERPIKTLRAYQTFDGKLHAPRVRFTRKSHGRELSAKQF